MTVTSTRPRPRSVGDGIGNCGQAPTVSRWERPSPRTGGDLARRRSAYRSSIERFGHGPCSESEQERTRGLHNPPDGHAAARGGSVTLRVGVVGAGIVGLAVARRLIEVNPDI